MAEVWATLFPTLVVALLHRLVFARPEVWAIARIDEGPVVRVPCVHEHLAVHARGLTRGHPIDLLMISRVRVVAGHIDAASRPAVGCHDEVQVRAAAQSDELAARTNLISDHDGCRRVQPADLSVKQQCEPSGSTIRRHANALRAGQGALLAKHRGTGTELAAERGRFSRIVRVGAPASAARRPRPLFIVTRFLPARFDCNLDNRRTERRWQNALRRLKLR